MADQVDHRVGDCCAACNMGQAKSGMVAQEDLLKCTDANGFLPGVDGSWNRPNAVNFMSRL
jgi:hypothetical protein